jgi:hypothetical protein
VARPGYLYGFANDAWGFSRNNSGTVRLTLVGIAELIEGVAGILTAR